MARISLGGQMKYVDFKTAKEGDLLVHGTYSHCKQGGKYNNYTHFVTPKEGGAVTGISCGHLNWIVTEFGIEKGMEVEIFYKGLGEKAIKGNRPHQVEVFINDDESSSEEEEKPAAPVKKTKKKAAGSRFNKEENNVSCEVDMGELE